MTAYAKPLIAIPSPRDLAAFAEAVERLPADKLFVKYMPEKDAYDVIREFFLEHEEYTHLAILPDDLIVLPYHWAQLIFDLHEYQFPVLCGVCNLDISAEHKGMLNVCIDHKPALSRYQPERTYEWLVEGSEQHKKLMDLTPPIIKVDFAGFPFMFFERGVIELFEFKDDRKPYNPMKLVGCCIDVMACADLYDLDIPIHCDLRVRMQHLKLDDQRVEGRMVGVKQPVVYFSKHE